jgi:nitrile hydratase
MNGIHDMGGMEGLGRIVHERDEPVFHAPWEGRVLAATVAAGWWKRWNTDAGRHERELLPPADYLRMSYYERWLAALEEILVRTGLVTRAEIETGRPAPGAARAEPPVQGGQAAAVLDRGSNYRRPLDAPPRFRPGSRVRVRNAHPSGHTRMPRYVRGHAGTVHMHHGGYVYPDTNAHFRGEDPRHLYSVRFEAAELWGESATGRGAVYVDLWEPYLEPA